MPISSQLLPLDEISLVVGSLFCAFAVYRSFVARRALVGPLYRKRALWTAVVSIYLMIVFVYELVGDFGVQAPYGSNGYFADSLAAALYYLALWGVGAIVVWSWVDSTVSVALDLDFFHRDLLFWRRGLRTALWVVWLLGVLLPVVPFTPNLSSEFTLAGLVEVGLLFVPLAFASIILGIGFARVHDDLLRGYTKWIGLVVVFTLVSVIAFPYNIPFLFVGYFMFRGAGSLSLRSRMEDSNKAATASSMGNRILNFRRANLT